MLPNDDSRYMPRSVSPPAAVNRPTNDHDSEETDWFLPVVRNTGPAEYPLLLEMANPRVFRANVFRITGLAVDATAREVSKHVDRLKLMEELGQGRTAHTAAFALTPPPQINQIREAIQKLKDPGRRLIDEFFWFWPEQFGQSQTDPAIRAITNGDSQTAIQIWQATEAKSRNALVASHNLAIFHHLIVLDRELNDLKAHTLSFYDWEQAFKRWEALADNDDFWDFVSNRIRLMDDGQLTTGVARRMRESLPEALDKINAQLAVKYAQSGQPAKASQHIQFMRKTHQGLDDVEKTSDLVLAPFKTQLREHLQQAKHACETNPASADKAATNLLQHAKPLLDLFELFYGKDHPTRNDHFDEVAETCLSCAIGYQCKSGDDQGLLASLQEILTLATTPDLKQRIEKNIRIGKSNLARELLDPVFKKLTAISECKETPREKYQRIQQEILPHLTRSTALESNNKEALEALSAAVALTLRSISIDSHNETGDTEFALELIAVARGVAIEPDLQQRIAEDLSQLTEIKQKRESNNVLLNIRGDQIEINARFVRYNGTIFQESEITGLRFGIFKHYTNGINDNTSYRVDIRSDRHGCIEIECKRIFRSEDQAQKDFGAILDALSYHVLPRLCTRIAKSIAAGHPLALDDSWLTKEGIRSTTGMLFWKEEVLIPWSDVRFGSSQGQLNLSSSKNPKFSRAYAAREVWNAVIFENITKARVKLR